MREGKSDIIVVGGGAAGLIAALRAAQLGSGVTLLEKNDRIGMKILISGGGKCNLTHAGSMEEIRATFRANEARFLKPSFYRFTNDDFLDILHAEGMQTYARPDGRIFPVEPGNAKDVVHILERVVRAAGVRIVTRAAVSGVVAEKGAAKGVRVGGETMPATRVVVAVGGSSYPSAGTTGDGWHWAQELGHSLVPLRAALAPLYLARDMPEWSGIALRDVVLRARTAASGKEYARWRGDLLFTHKGLSGPCALGISREIADRMASDAKSSGEIEVDMTPDEPFEALRDRVRAELNANSRRMISAIADRYFPDRLALPFLASVQIDPQTRGPHLSSKDLNRFVTGLKGWQLGPVRTVPLERGEVVAGGVSLDEVGPQTMESRLVKGLYLCGEILDIAGPVGGYNLQAAWSTGWVAGTSSVA